MTDCQHDWTVTWVEEYVVGEYVKILIGCHHCKATKKQKYVYAEEKEV